MSSCGFVAAIGKKGAPTERSEGAGAPEIEVTDQMVEVATDCLLRSGLVDAVSETAAMRLAVRSLLCKFHCGGGYHAPSICDGAANVRRVRERPGNCTALIRGVLGVLRGWYSEASDNGRGCYRVVKQSPSAGADEINCLKSNMCRFLAGILHGRHFPRCQKNSAYRRPKRSRGVDEETTNFRLEIALRTRAALF